MLLVQSVRSKEENMKIFPGLNITFSWKRALGITKAKRRVAKKTGIPTTRAGRQRKVGRTLGF